MATSSSITNSWEITSLPNTAKVYHQGSQKDPKQTLFMTTYFNNEQQVHQIATEYLINKGATDTIYKENKRLYITLQDYETCIDQTSKGLEAAKRMQEQLEKVRQYSAEDMPGALHLGLSQRKWLTIHWMKLGMEREQVLTERERAFNIPDKSDISGWDELTWAQYLD